MRLPENMRIDRWRKQENETVGLCSPCCDCDMVCTCRAQHMEEKRKLLRLSGLRTEERKNTACGKKEKRTGLLSLLCAVREERKLPLSLDSGNFMLRECL